MSSLELALALVVVLLLAALLVSPRKTASVAPQQSGAAEVSDGAATDASASPGRWKRPLLIGIALIITAGGAAWWTGKLEAVFDKSLGAKPACEEALLSVLSAPATYKLVWSNHALTDEVSFDGYKAYRDNRDCPPQQLFAGACELSISEQFVRSNGISAELKSMGVASMDKATRKQWQQATERLLHKEYASYQQGPSAFKRSAIVLLEYDAENGFGARQRAFVVCQFGPAGNDERFSTKDLASFGSVPNELGEESKRIREMVH